MVASKFMINTSRMIAHNVCDDDGKNCSIEWEWDGSSPWTMVSKQYLAEVGYNSGRVEPIRDLLDGVLRIGPFKLQVIHGLGDPSEDVLTCLRVWDGEVAEGELPTRPTEDV